MQAGEGGVTGGWGGAVVGAKVDLACPADYLGAGPETLAEIAGGRHPFAETLKGAERPAIIVGMGALARADGAAVLATARAIADECKLAREGWNGFNVLHTAAARVGGLDLGFVPGERSEEHTSELLSLMRISYAVFCLKK